ncbi:MAG: tyrosine-type recombinase/integrase [Proteobacteria bacterium]|nr:tyrosine-type recombinase/integrase [Pseudomonadota bacterium]
MSAHCTMQDKVATYLRERHQAGYKMSVLGSQLRSFAHFADNRGHRGPLTVELALDWARASPSNTRPGVAAGRLAQLRAFAKFCHGRDPRSEIPPAQFFGPYLRRVTPHIYTSREVRSLISAAAECRTVGSLRAHSYATLFGLLASTGLRLSEALALEHRDVDLQQGLLHIRVAKFHKVRYVPLHPTTRHALQRYVRRCQRHISNTATQRFFIGHAGRPLSLRSVQNVFERLREKLGWRSRGGHSSPRIHDLRFTFICRRLERWYAQGLDIDQLMLSLYTYVGHVDVTSTYWYLTATPELMRLAARRAQTVMEGAS